MNEITDRIDAALAQAREEASVTDAERAREWYFGNQGADSVAGKDIADFRERFAAYCEAAVASLSALLSSTRAEGRAAGIEEAAKVADAMYDRMTSSGGILSLALMFARRDAAVHIAAAIRRLKEESRG